MPWLTRPCLEWLNSLDLSQMNVFEYGCGASSLWFKSKAYTLAGVDTKKEWVWLRNQWVSDAETEYVRGCLTVWDELFDSQIEEWDIIVIDGDFRDDCTEYALKALNKGGYLIADNFEQPSADLAHWPKTRELTKHLPLTIYKEPGHEDWKTAVWSNEPK